MDGDRHALGCEYARGRPVTAPSNGAGLVDGGSIEIPNVDPAAAAAELQRRQQALAAARYDDGDDVDFDFDAHWRNVRAKPKTIKVLGRVYELPASVPAKVMLFAMRNSHNPGRRVQLTEVMELLGMIVGQKALDQMLEDGIGFEDQLTDVLAYCMRRYNELGGRGGAGAGGPGEAPAGPSVPGSSSPASSATTAFSAPTGAATSA